jgi:hypothetical protein
MAQGDARQPRRAFHLRAGDRAAHDRAGLRAHRQHSLDRGQGGQPQRRPLFGLQGRRDRAKTAIFDQITQEHIDFMLSRIPRNRFVTVAEVASMVAWLASAENSFATGAVFDISGGRATY